MNNLPRVTFNNQKQIPSLIKGIKIIRHLNNPTINKKITPKIYT